MTEGKGKKKKRSKASLDFIVPIKSTTTTEEGKKEKNPKESTEQIKHKNNVFLESLLLEPFPSLGITVHLASPRLPSNTVLVSGPSVGQLRF